jgi:hypothetical protein
MKKHKKEKREKRHKREKIEEKQISMPAECIPAECMLAKCEKKPFFCDVKKQAIYKNIKQNFIFYIVLTLCLFTFTKCNHNKSNSYLTLFSLGVVSFAGYFVHLVSHYMEFKLSTIYNSYDNIFTRNKYINWIALNFIDFYEFHFKTHHDTTVNKTFKNISYEFMNNFISQGGVLIIIKFFLDLLDNRVILLWALLYATVHNINYNILSPSTHQEHHINDKTNYGMDIWDIIIGSKFDWDNIETHNHASINLIVITAGIYYLSNKFKL